MTLKYIYVCTNLQIKIFMYLFSWPHTSQYESVKVNNRTKIKLGTRRTIINEQTNE